MDPVEISASDLLLRAWRPTDAEAVHRACQDPLIPRWTPIRSPYRYPDAVEYVGPVTARQFADGTGVPLGVFDAASGELLGFCGLVRLDLAGRTAELGYWTAAWARGRGVTERAARALAGWAFDTLGLRRLTWRADVGNHVSRLIAVRLGFHLDGVIRAHRLDADGRGVAGWAGALLPADLAAANAARPAAPGSVAARRAHIFGRPQPELTARSPGGVIRLRRPARRDVPAIVRACRDTDSIRWIPVPEPYETAHAEQFVDAHVPGRWERGDGMVVALADADDEFAGDMELRISPTDPAVADVGFLTAPWARGRGYAPAALGALCDWGFAALGLVRVEWRAHVGNSASRRVAEKAGFTMEGVARSALVHRGERLDAWVGARTATDGPAA